MAATLPELLKDPIASPFLPIGPTASDRFPPNVRDPADIKDRYIVQYFSQLLGNDIGFEIHTSAERELSTIRKSVTSAPA
jgi:hypothetical protein